MAVGILVRRCRGVVAEDLHGEVLLCDTDRAVVHRVPTADAPWAADLALGVAVEVGDDLLVRQLIEAGMVEQVTGSADTSRRQIITRTAGAAAVAGAASIVLPSVAAAASPSGSTTTTTTTTTPPADPLATWQPATGTSGTEWWGLAYGAGVFVAMSAGNQSLRSTDGGTTWTAGGLTNLRPGSNFPRLAFGPVGGSSGTFVAVATSADPLNGPRVAYSTDKGMTWTTPATNPSAQQRVWTGVTYGDSKFVAVAASNFFPPFTKRVMTSTDGINWSNPATAPPVNVWFDVAHGNGTFVAVARSGADRVMTSTNGEDWVVRTVPLGAWYRITFGNGTFVAVADSRSADPPNPTNNPAIMTSTDGINWTVPSGPEVQYADITFGGERFVALTWDGKIVTSSDAVTWTVTATGLNSAQAIAHGGGKFVAVGNGVGYSSPVPVPVP